MAYLIFGGFILVVVVAVWISSRRGRPLNGCCAPADPRHDLRMRPAYTNDEVPSP
jgi:hypothetical protein